MNNLTFAWFAFFGFGIILIILGEIKTEIARTNKNLNAVMKKVGIEESFMPEVEKLIKEGKTVEAIKKYRKETGIGLKEAKEYIDSINK